MSPLRHARCSGVQPSSLSVLFMQLQEMSQREGKEGLRRQLAAALGADMKVPSTSATGPAGANHEVHKSPASCQGRAAKKPCHGPSP